MAGECLEESLFQISNLIEQDQFSEASAALQVAVTQHPDWIDARFRVEMQMIMKQMEYKMALKDFSYLRSMTVVFRYLEANYGKVYQERVKAQETDTQVSDGCGKQGGGPSLISGDQLEYAGADTIWWCWLQGLDQAPEIVKRCHASIMELQKFGKRVITLDENNIQEYVALPDFIMEKYRAGIIGMAHFSDLVRLELLTTRGGTWIDATTLLTGTQRFLPLLEEDLFMYRAGNVSEYLIFDNWFMHARKPSMILNATKDLLYSYWEKENEAKHYFIFHLLMTYACQLFREEYEKIPRFSNEPCHVLQHELDKPFSEKRWEQILGMSDVHKLTYRMEKEPAKNSFWEFIQKRL